MAESTEHKEETSRLWWFPPARWLVEYRMAWLPGDIVAGVTLAAYAIPVSLAYAGLAGLEPQVGIYGYLLGGLGYALLGSSRQLAVGPTSAISLMIAGTVGAMAEGDAQRYAQIASLVAFTVAGLCVFAWVLRLSALVKLISDSILVGFKAGAGLTIAMTHCQACSASKAGATTFSKELGCWPGNSVRCSILFPSSASSRSGSSCLANACCPESRSRWGLLHWQSLLPRCWGFLPLGCR